MILVTSRTSSGLRTAALVLGGVAFGVGVAFGATTLSHDDAAAQTFGRAAAPEGSAPLLDPARLAEVEGERTRADNPVAAVEAFLAAEAENDYETSFGYLADAVRAEYGSPEAWAADHPDALPPVTDFTVEDAAGESSTVTTMTRYRSSLDAVTGLVPARALTSWVTVEEEGGWAVDVSATTQQALLPPDSEAVPAAQEWAQRLQACQVPEEEMRALRARADLASRLCGVSGDIRATAVTPLPQFDAAPLQTSFGADVVSWARVVPLEGPVPLRAVLAPVDDRWTVIGVLAPGGGAQ